MKVKILVPKDVDIKFVRVEVAVRYDDEQIPYDFPLRNGDMWKATIDIDDGRILDWQDGKSGRLYLKVVDEGSYYLIDDEGNEVLSIEEYYVPNKLLPGKYGDYIDLNIDEKGFITNWYKNPSIFDFLKEE